MMMFLLIPMNGKINNHHDTTHNAYHIHHVPRICNAPMQAPKSNLGTLHLATEGDKASLKFAPIVIFRINRVRFMTC